MRILIASDLHANLEALAVLPRDYDQLWILGDLVNYGPNPAEVVDFVMKHETFAIKGNHDYAIGFGEDPRCYGAFRELADVSRRFTQNQLSGAHLDYLRHLPLQLEVEAERTRFWLCHAMPSDPLFGYIPAESGQWEQECRHLPVDIVLVGHTHTAFMKKVGRCLLVNPGSLGQPNNRSALACYAVWKNGSITLRSTAYDVDTTIRKMQALPFPEVMREKLITLLRMGRLEEGVAPETRAVH